MNQVKRWLPVAVIAGFAYLLYANWQSKETEPLAYATACSSGGCADVKPAQTSRNPFTHVFKWQQGGGLTKVTCRRGMVLFGRWECKLGRKRAAAVEARDDMRSYPADTKRSVE
jgi:hypothetical protein